jgi:hypothetical protein
MILIPFEMHTININKMKKGLWSTGFFSKGMTKWIKNYPTFSNLNSQLYFITMKQ